MTVPTPAAEQSLLKQSLLWDRPWYLLLTLILSALAGGMAWGIRGQYGHETGAMIFGPLVGFTLVMLYLPQGSSLQAARVVALLTMAVGFGGSMSYGETVGLTHDHELHRRVALDEAEKPVLNDAGNPVYEKHRHWRAYRWGMLGLFVKGGLWIGFAGAFLGLGLGGRIYKPLEMLGLSLAMLGLMVLGMWALNTPFDPVYEEVTLDSGHEKPMLVQEETELPTIYFSDHWDWEPLQYLKPRPENWGGVLFAFTGFLVYLQFFKRDQLAVNMAFWGVIGGLGFPIGQVLQASHGFDSAAFRDFFPIMYGVNTWNLMECTFGLVAGFALGLGIWLNRKRISQSDAVEEVPLSVSWESWLMVAYIYLMLVGWFLEDSIFGYFYEYGILMGVIPIVAIIGGRFWPYLYAFPLVTMPIAVKTFRAISVSSNDTPPFIPTTIGWLLIVTVPLLLLTLAALYFARQSRLGAGARLFACLGLLISSTVLFWLNFAFFRFPWNWMEGWAFQSNSGMIYIVAWLALSFCAILFYWKSGPDQKISEGPT